MFDRFPSEYLHTRISLNLLFRVRLGFVPHPMLLPGELSWRELD